MMCSLPGRGEDTKPLRAREPGWASAWRWPGRLAAGPSVARASLVVSQAGGRGPAAADPVPGGGTVTPRSGGDRALAVRPAGRCAVPRLGTICDERPLAAAVRGRA